MGCAHLPKVSLPGITAQGPADNGSPVTVGKSDSGVSLVLPAGSKVVKREIKGLGYRPATKDAPAQPETPDQTVTEFILSAPSEYHETKQDIKASSGTVDTSIRQHQIDAEEGRPLLYAAIVAALAAGFFVWRAYPTPAICCGVASVVFFMAWKVSGLPSWFWAVGLAAIVGGGALYLGHHRGLYEPVPEDKKP